MNTKISKLVFAFILATAVCGVSFADQPYTTSWVANSFGAADGHWVQLGAQAMYTASDGSVYLNTVWDEGGHETSIYKDGAVVGAFDHTHGWGYMGGSSVAANDKYVYLAQTMTNEGGGLVNEHTWPVKGNKWIGLTRRLRATRGPAPFAGGKGGTAGDTLKDIFLVIDDVAEKTDGTVTGLAATNGRLYVSDSVKDVIHVYDAETMVEISSWPCPRPGQLAIGTDGSVWVIQSPPSSDPAATAKATIISFTSNGAPRQQWIANAGAPDAIAFSPDGRLLVGDGGPDQQVKIYDHLDTTPQLSQSLGVKGGIYAPPRSGATGLLRFNGITGVGADSSGNIYVCSGGNGTVLESYTPAQKLRWHVEGLTFVDCGQIDPANGRDLYTRASRFVLDYKSTTGPMGRYVGYTVDRFRYPDDARLHSAPTTAWIRHIAGKRFLYMTDMYSSFLAIFKLNDTDEIAKPSGLFEQRHVSGDWPPNQPAKGRWIWRDSNGDGKFDAAEFDGDGADDPGIWGWNVDNRGDIWEAYLDDLKIVHFPCKGIDKQGNPIYSRSSSVTSPAPAPFDQPHVSQLDRLEYFPDADVMYLSGFTADHPNKRNNWKTIGPVVCRYDHWSTKPQLRWQITVPFDEMQEQSKTFGTPVCMCLAGRYLFVGYLTTAEIHVFDIATGAAVTVIKPGPEVGGKSGWIDIPYGLTAYARPTGEYVIVAEDDAFAKMIVYRWTPPAQ